MLLSTLVWFFIAVSFDCSPHSFIKFFALKYVFEILGVIWKSFEVILILIQKSISVIKFHFQFQRHMPS